MPSALPASCTAHLSSHSLESEPRRTSPPPPLLGWGHRAQSRRISQPEAFSLPHSSCGTEESRSPGKIYSWDQEGPTRRPHCASRPPSSRNVSPLAGKLSSVLASALGVCRGGSCHFSNTHHLSSHWSHWPPALSHLILSVNTQQGTHNYPPNPERRTHSHRRRDFLRSQLRRQAET